MRIRYRKITGVPKAKPKEPKAETSTSIRRKKIKDAARLALSKAVQGDSYVKAEKKFKRADHTIKNKEREEANEMIMSTRCLSPPHTTHQPP